MGKLLGEIFVKQTIKTDLLAKTKEAALIELIDTIAALRPECVRSDLLSVITEREEKMNTGIGNGIAIPHASYRGIDNMVGAIGISKQGIDYGALDNKPVHIIFLLALTQQADEEHLHTLNLIFNLVQSKALETIQNAKNIDDIHSILSQIR